MDRNTLRFTGVDTALCRQASQLAEWGQIAWEDNDSWAAHVWLLVGLALVAAPNQRRDLRQQWVVWAPGLAWARDCS